MIRRTSAAVTMMLVALAVITTSLLDLAMGEDATCSSSTEASCVPEDQKQHIHNVPKDTSGGYILFCLCMGRYGNQMEHLLGALAEAKRRSPQRIIVLPSFISWRYGSKNNAFIPVEAVFSLDTLREFHPNIVSYQEFQKMIASGVGSDWKAEEATIYCKAEWARRLSDFQCKKPDIDEDGSYWHSLGVKFVEETFHEEDVFDLDPADHPVVIVNGALSAPFPMRPRDRYVARYLQWTELVKERRRSFFVSSGISDDDIVVAAHLRAGSDWVKACEHAAGRDSYMASPQCSEEMRQHNLTEGITYELCLPTADMSSVAKYLRIVAKKARSSGSLDNKSGARLVLFVASDLPNLGKDLMKEFGLDDLYDMLISPSSTAESSGDGIEALAEDASFLDLIVMTYADYMIGNCVSSFTSFAARIRTEQHIGIGTDFFGLVDAEA